MTPPEASSAAAALIRAHYGIERGELTVGGVAVGRLAERLGTPLYLYDAGVMRGKLARLRRRNESPHMS